MLLQPLSITLRGITNALADPSVDVWRTVTLPLLRQATGLSDGFELKIIKRGAEPLVCGPASCHALISTPCNTCTNSCIPLTAFGNGLLAFGMSISHVLMLTRLLTVGNLATLCF